MEFTEEQKILLASVKRAVEKHIAPVTAETDREGRFNWGRLTNRTSPLKSLAHYPAFGTRVLGNNSYHNRENALWPIRCRRRLPSFPLREPSINEKGLYRRVSTARYH